MCFAVTRGELPKRFDPKFLIHGGHQELAGTATLANLVLFEPEYGSGSRSVPRTGDEVKYIRVTDFGDDGIAPDHEFVTAENAETKYALSDGDILFARSGATAGKTFIYTEDIGPAIFAGYCIRFQFDRSQVLPWFVYYYTKTPRYQDWVRSIQRPSGQPNINKEEFKAFTLPLPPLDVQQALVADMDAAREARRDTLARADGLLSGLDGYLLEQLGLTAPPKDARQVYAVRLGELNGKRIDAPYQSPQHVHTAKALSACLYPKDTLDNISPKPVGGATPTKGDADLYADKGIKFLRILNVTPNEIRLADVKYIQPSVNEGELFRSQLAADDVLMTITGRVGTAAVVTEDILPANINQHIVRLRIERKECLPFYLAAYLNSSVGLGLSNRLVTGGTRIALDYEAIKSLQVPLPPLPIQQAIADEVSRRRAEARRLRQHAEQDWAAAKARFERLLLGEGAGTPEGRTAEAA